MARAQARRQRQPRLCRRARARTARGPGRRVAHAEVRGGAQRCGRRAAPGRGGQRPLGGGLVAVRVLHFDVCSASLCAPSPVGRERVRCERGGEARALAPSSHSSSRSSSLLALFSPPLPHSRRPSSCACLDRRDGTSERQCAATLSSTRRDSAPPSCRRLATSPEGFRGQERADCKLGRE